MTEAQVCVRVLTFFFAIFPFLRVRGAIESVTDPLFARIQPFIPAKLQVQPKPKNPNPNPPTSQAPKP